MPADSPPEVDLFSIVAIIGAILLILPQAAAFAIPPTRPALMGFLDLLSIVGDILLIIAWVNLRTLAHWSNVEEVGSILIAIFVVLMHVTVYLLHRGTYRMMRRRIKKVEGPGLARALQDGDMRLLSIRWLMMQPAGYILRSRVHLEAEEGALIPPDEAKRLLRHGRIAALSYRWLAHHESDPEGFHVAAIRAFYFDETRPFTSAWRQLNYPALFIEYGAMGSKGAMTSGRR